RATGRGRARPLLVDANPLHPITVLRVACLLARTGRVHSSLLFLAVHRPVDRRRHAADLAVDAPKVSVRQTARLRDDLLWSHAGVAAGAGSPSAGSGASGRVGVSAGASGAGDAAWAAAAASVAAPICVAMSYAGKVWRF